MVGYFGYQEGFEQLKVWLSAVLHAMAHFGAIIALNQCAGTG